METDGKGKRGKGTGTSNPIRYCIAFRRSKLCPPQTPRSSFSNSKFPSTPSFFPAFRTSSWRFRLRHRPRLLFPRATTSSTHRDSLRGSRPSHPSTPSRTLSTAAHRTLLISAPEAAHTARDFIVLWKRWPGVMRLPWEKLVRIVMGRGGILWAFRRDLRLS